MEKKIKIKKQRKNTEERREEILNAAFNAFLKQGYAATKVESIAQEIGITKGLIFFYFPNKETLFSEMIQEYICKPLYTNILNTPITEEKIAAQLYKTIQYIISFIQLKPQLVLLVKLILVESERFPELASFHYENVVTPFLTHINLLLSEGINRGEWTEKDIPKYPHLIVAPSIIFLMWNATFIQNPLDYQDFTHDQACFILRSLGIHIS